MILFTKGKISINLLKVSICKVILFREELFSLGLPRPEGSLWWHITWTISLVTDIAARGQLVVNEEHRMQAPSWDTVVASCWVEGSFLFIYLFAQIFIHSKIFSISHMYCAKQLGKKIWSLLSVNLTFSNRGPWLSRKLLLVDAVSFAASLGWDGLFGSVASSLLFPVVK